MTGPGGTAPRCGVRPEWHAAFPGGAGCFFTAPR